MNTNSSKERGAAAVEFALVVPLLIAFLFGIVEGGTRYSQQAEVNHWAFIVARDLAIDPSKSASTLVTTLKGADTHTYTAATTGGCTSGGTSVTVTVTSERDSITGLFGNYTLKGKGVARCE